MKRYDIQRERLRKAAIVFHIKRRRRLANGAGEQEEETPSTPGDTRVTASGDTRVTASGDERVIA